jgi:hypothetical protein
VPLNCTLLDSSPDNFFVSTLESLAARNNKNFWGKCSKIAHIRNIMMHMYINPYVVGDRGLKRQDGVIMQQSKNLSLSIALLAE